MLDQIHDSLATSISTEEFTPQIDRILQILQSNLRVAMPSQTILELDLDP